ncbi:unnamed protein product, partial [Vitis vinifera]|uniref:Uncharacterized protein n=1 Tax=Vitis vinifera TaxID=29760 RepID=D7T0L3_VITVI
MYESSSVEPLVHELKSKANFGKSLWFRICLFPGRLESKHCIICDIAGFCDTSFQSFLKLAAIIHMKNPFDEPSNSCIQIQLLTSGQHSLSIFLSTSPGCFLGLLSLTYGISISDSSVPFFCALSFSLWSSGKETFIFLCTSSSSATIAYCSMTSYFLVTGGTRLVLVMLAPHSGLSVTEYKPSSAVNIHLLLTLQHRLPNRNTSLSVSEAVPSLPLLPPSEDLSRSSHESLTESINFLFNLDKRLLISPSDAFCQRSNPKGYSYQP